MLAQYTAVRLRPEAVAMKKLPAVVSLRLRVTEAARPCLPYSGIHRVIPPGMYSLTHRAAIYRIPSLKYTRIYSIYRIYVYCIGQVSLGAPVRTPYLAKVGIFNLLSPKGLHVRLYAGFRVIYTGLPPPCMLPMPPCNHIPRITGTVRPCAQYGLALRE